MIKKSMFILAFVMPILILSGCENSFDPKKNYQEKYILNLVIKGDSVKQLAVIAKTYDVPGYNPNENQTSPFIKGATITMYSSFYKNTYLFSDSTSSEIGQKYGNSAPVYVLKSMKARPNDTLRLTAVMPDGTILRSTCAVPRDLDFRLSKNFISTATQNPNEKNLSLTGQLRQTTSLSLNLYFITQLTKME
ncbi:MAG: DUF4249 family protein [Ignavibacteriales bacterium]|nr:DUF4249 family protein [Ignavibacteriales bacterium]